MNDRKPFDLDSYMGRIQSSPCFICEMIAGRLKGNHIIQQNDQFIIFLNKYPTLYGYTLVAPIQHKEQVTGDFSLDEYLALQRTIYQTAEAVRKSINAERVYILSLGSQQGNRHVHSLRVSRFSSIPLMNLLFRSVFWYFGVSLTLRRQCRTHV